MLKVHAAGVNRTDILQRQGFYASSHGTSPFIGLEVAGTVVEVGENVHKLVVGDKICTLVTGGGYAEYAVAPAELCLPIPKGLTMEETAGLPLVFLTVWINLFERGHLKPGESVLIQGGSSGLGLIAIQLAKLLGSTVYATAGTAEKCAVCEQLGATRAINYKTEDFVAVIKDLTQDRGVDVVLDIVGGDYVNREISILALDGRLLFVGTMGSVQANFNIREVMYRRLTITGSSLRVFSLAYLASMARLLEEKVWPLIEEGKINLSYYKQFPLEKATEAHRLIESSEHIGKIVLTL